MKRQKNKRQSQKTENVLNTEKSEIENNRNGAKVPREVLEKLPKNTQIAYTQSISFDGPIPPPILLEEYEKIQKGMTDRIMTMAESEMAHRHQWERDLLTAEKTNFKLSSWLGSCIAFFSILAACFCAYINQQLVAILFLVPPTSGVLLAIPRIIRLILGENNEK